MFWLCVRNSKLCVPYYQIHACFSRVRFTDVFRQQIYICLRRVRAVYVALADKFIQRFPFDSEILNAVPLLNPTNRLDFRAAKGKLLD